jgi:hypothetical protein
MVGFLLALAAGPENSQSNIVWRWASDPGECELRQGITGTATVLGISRIPTSDQTIVTIYDRSGNSDQTVVTIHDRFGDRDAARQNLGGVTVQLTTGARFSAAGYTAPGSNPASSHRQITLVVGDPQFLSKFAGTSSLSIAHQNLGEVSFPVRAAAAAARALSRCEDRKLRQWGISPELLNTLQRRPIPLTPVSTWLRDDIYPHLGIQLGAKGYLVLLLAVAPDGSVQRCAAVEASVYREFYLAACDALKRSARFQPALDLHGEPIAAPYLIPVQFDIEDAN